MTADPTADMTPAEILASLLVGQTITLSLTAADSTDGDTTITGLIHRLKHKDGVVAELGILTDTRQPSIEVAVYRDPLGDTETTVSVNGVPATIPITVIDPDPGLPLSSHRDNTHCELTDLRARGATDAHLTQVAAYLRRAEAHHGHDDTHPATNQQPTALTVRDLNAVAWAAAPAPLDPAHYNSRRAANAIPSLQAIQADATSTGDPLDLPQLGLFALAAYPARNPHDPGAANVASLLADLRHLADAYNVNLDASHPDNPQARFNALTSALATAMTTATGADPGDPDAAVQHLLGHSMHLLLDALRALVTSHTDGHDRPCLYCEGPASDHDEDTFGEINKRAFDRYFEELTTSSLPPL